VSAVLGEGVADLGDAAGDFRQVGLAPSQATSMGTTPEAMKRRHETYLSCIGAVPRDGRRLRTHQVDETPFHPRRPAGFSTAPLPSPASSRGRGRARRRPRPPARGHWGCRRARATREVNRPH
jgi:hypothetical protein